MEKFAKAIQQVALCFMAIVLILSFCRTNNRLLSLDRRLRVLEVARVQTVEIIVERAYDADMAQYGYKMIAVLPEKKREPLDLFKEKP